MRSYSLKRQEKQTMENLLLLTAVLLPLASGCSDSGTSRKNDKQLARYEELIQRVERGDYTTYRSRPHMVRVKEVQELFQYKEAYPWLINAINSKDEAVSATVMDFWNSSDNPGTFSKESMQKWYDVPDEQLQFDGFMWRPKNRVGGSTHPTVVGGMATPKGSP